MIVNGRVALRDGKATGEQGGVVLRRTGNMPSRPMDLGAARRVTVAGVATRLSGGWPLQVTIDVRQARQSQHARGTIIVVDRAAKTTVRSVALGTLQTKAGWASLTGRARINAAGQERSFTLIVERADPFVDGSPSTIRLSVEGRAPIEGRLDRLATIVPGGKTPRSN